MQVWCVGCVHPNGKHEYKVFDLLPPAQAHRAALEQRGLKVTLWEM